MRLVILTQYYPPEMGAPQARLSELAAMVSAKGHEVVVLTAMPSYPLGRLYPGYGGVFQSEVLDGIRVIRCWIFPSKSGRLVPRLLNYFSFAASSLAVGILALPRADFLLTESPPLFLGMTGFLLSRLKGARWMFNVSDLWPESAVRLGMAGEGAGLRLARWLEGFCYRRAWLVTGQSREIIEDISRRHGHACTFHLSNGVDTSLFRPRARADPARRELAAGASFVALYAGLHGLAQGLHYVLEAAALVKDMPGLRIVFVGDGPVKENLVRRARELDLANVLFREPVERREMPAVLAAADAAIVPLGLRLPGAVPSKLYEAMAAGVPVILAAEGEAAEIVRSSGCGLTVRPGDVGALAGALRRLAGDPAERSAMGRRGRERAARDYDRKAIADAFVNVLAAEAGT